MTVMLLVGSCTSCGHQRGAADNMDSVQLQYLWFQAAPPVCGCLCSWSSALCLRRDLIYMVAVLYAERGSVTKCVCSPNIEQAIFPIISMVHWQNASVNVRFEEFSLGYKSVSHKNAHKSFWKRLVYLFHTHYGHRGDLGQTAPDPGFVCFPKLLTVKQKTISLPTWSWSETDRGRLVLNAESLQ